MRSRLMYTKTAPPRGSSPRRVTTKAGMLVRRDAGEVELLPALPTAWPSGSVKGQRQGPACWRRL